MANTNDVTDAEFDTLVLKSDRPVVVDFWAAWCGPCRMIAPIVEQIAEEFSGRVTVLKMDVDANPRTPASLGVMSLPTVMMFKGGQAVERQLGYRAGMKQQLAERLTALL